MFRRKDDSHEFKPLLVEIEDEPVHPLGRAIFWIIVTAIIFFCGWMYFGKVDVVVSARGKVIPVGEIKILQPLTTGSVSRILTQEGDFVKKGQVLMEIDPSSTEPELESMKVNARQLELELLRLNAVLHGYKFDPGADAFDPALIAVQQELYNATMTRLQKQLKVKEKELQQVHEQMAGAREEQKRLQKLFRIADDKLQRLDAVKDIVSRNDFAQAESEAKSLEGSLIAAAYRIKELDAVRERIRHEINVIEESERDKTLSEIAEKQNNLNYLQANIEKATYVNGKQQLVAPVDGYVNKLLIHTIGGVVTPAEKLIAIVPANSALTVKALVQNKDIGFIDLNVPASIKVDTFSFQKYGTLEGIVAQVARDSIEDKQLGLVYEVYITPLKSSLLVDGVLTPVTTGMSITAEIKVGKRRIIEFFIYPLIKYLDEGISVR